MARKSNRAFTLVELIIVIAVIGVLAAILIPVFSNVVKKANIADKTSLARNLNTQIAAAKEETISVRTMSEAMAIAHRAGYTDDQIFNTKTAGTIVFNNATGNFAVAEKVENGTATLAYADQGMKTAPASNLMAPVDANNIPSSFEYGMYLVDETGTLEIASLDVTASLDVGSVFVREVNFNTNESVEATLVTAGGTVNINAPHATVNHYGYADQVNITSIDTHSYHEFGTVAIIKITAGHLVIEAGAHVLQGIKTLALEGISITLYAEAALVGNQSQLQGLITEDTDSSNVEYFATMPESVGFAGGSGTKADPYLIASANTFKFIGTQYGNGVYTYYKVMDGVKEIDLSSAKAQYGVTHIYGEFDGNGCHFTNIQDCAMFENVGQAGGQATVLKNFSFTVTINSAPEYHQGGLADYVPGAVLIENVQGHGYIEASTPASFIAYGPGNAGVWDCTFRNVTSDMELVATAYHAGGFIAHQYTQKGGTITFENSEFTGSVALTGTYTARYFTAMQYATANIIVKNDKELPISGGYGAVGEHTLTTVTNALYTASANIAKVTKGNLTAPEFGEVFSVAAGDAVTAKAFFMAGPNDVNNTGNYTCIFMEENCVLDGGTFKTDKIKRFHITVNGNATPKTGVSEDGLTFNIVGDNRGTTCGSSSVTIKLYNANGTLVGVYTYQGVKNVDFQG